MMRDACYESVRCLLADSLTLFSPRPSTGFVEEMRFVAMKLHTKDQAPKEGEREAAANSWAEVR
jgi:hypothetical protein